MKKETIIHNVKDFAVITFGAALAAAAIFFFMLPSNVAVGSASALAMVLSNFIPLPVSALNLAINVILLIIGFILIGSEFGAKTVYTSIMVPAFMGVFEWIFPNFQSLTGDPFLDVLCYILVVGMAMAILFSRNASSGGLDIVAKIINKYLKIDLGKAVSFSGIAVALTSAFCYDTKIVVLSVLGTTLNEIIGAYDNTPRKEVITIVDKHEYRKLMDFVRKTDPKAFVTVYSVNEMRYQPKIKK